MPLGAHPGRLTGFLLEKRPFVGNIRKGGELRRARTSLTALRISGGGMCGGVIHKIFQFLAGFEVRNFLRGHFHFFSGLRIASHASTPLAGAETTESANFDFFAFLQSANDAVKYGLDNRFRFLAWKFRHVQNFLDQVGLRECRCRLLGHLRYASSRSPGTGCLTPPTAYFPRTQCSVWVYKGLAYRRIAPFPIIKMTRR